MITAPNSPTSPLAHPSPWNSTATESSSSQSVAQNKSTQISFTTKEGDLVTLSARHLIAAQMASHTTTSDAGSSTNFTASALKADSFAVSVQGDLNEEELRDINQLMAKLTTIASDFFNGDMKTALAGATRIGGLGSISKLTAEFSSTSTLAARTQLRANHPLPDLGNLAASGSGLADFAPDQERQYKEAMKSRWQQIRDSLHQAPHPAPTHATKAQGADATALPVSKAPSPDSPSQRLVREANSFITKNPRLSPFLLPLASRAIDQVSAQADPATKSPWRTPEQLMAALSNYLNS